MKAETRTNFLGSIVAAMVVTLFGLALLAHDPLVFWNDDYELSILPVCHDMARAWSHGEMPLLSPYSWVCGNLAGEYQYGVFSLFVNAAIVGIWKLPLTFPEQAAALAMVHLALLAAGGFMLARGRKFSVTSSMLVAIVAALNGWIICWGATDWLGALGAFTWLPWAWWASERALDPAAGRFRFLWPAPFVYLLFTGGFPYTVLMFALVVAWLGVRFFIQRRPASGILPLAAGLALGAGLSAPALLALLNYVQGSARAGLSPTSHFQWLVPWRAWPALFLPSWTVPWSDFFSDLVPHAGTELACGLVPGAVLIAGLIARGRATTKKIGWELLLLAIVFVAAMLPTAGMFRWSFRWLPLFHLVLALCAAKLLPTSFDSAAAQSLPAAVGLGALGLTSALAFLLKCTGNYWYPLTWVLLALVALWFIGDRFAKTHRWSAPAICALALLTTYLCIPPNCGVPKYHLPQSLLEPAPLDPARLYVSFYPPPERDYRREVRPGPVGQTLRLGSASMWAGLHFINGYSPIRPAGVAREFATSIHGEIDENMALWLAEHEAQAGGLLDRLGIDGVIIASEWKFAPLPREQWTLSGETSEGRIYHRAGGPFPTVRSVAGTNATIHDIHESRTRVTAQVATGDSAATLTFSRPFFPGYEADLDGRSLVVSTVKNLTPLVEIPARTRGTITLTYRPGWLVQGGIVAVLCGVLWIAGAVWAFTARLARA